MRRLESIVPDPEQAPEGPARDFALNMVSTAEDELYDTSEEVTKKLKEIYIANGNDVGDASQLNILFGARLIYQADAWVDAWILSRLQQRLPDLPAQEIEICHFLIDLYRRERINIHTLSLPDPLETRWDVLAWRQEKFQKPLSAYALATPLRVGFSLKASFSQKIDSFLETHKTSEGLDLYVNLLQGITPRSDLLMQLDYV